MFVEENIFRVKIMTKIWVLEAKTSVKGTLDPGTVSMVRTNLQINITKGKIESHRP